MSGKPVQASDLRAGPYSVLTVLEADNGPSWTGPPGPVKGHAGEVAATAWSPGLRAIHLTIFY